MLIVIEISKCMLFTAGQGGDTVDLEWHVWDGWDKVETISGKNESLAVRA